MSNIKELLLVDDDKICNFYMKNLLSNCQELDAKIRTALNGLEAIEIIENHWLNNTQHKNTTKLIFLDLNMPVMDGFEFLDTYSKHPLGKNSDIVIYVLSSSLNTSDQEKALSYTGVEEYLTKPIDAVKLKDILNKY